MSPVYTILFDLGDTLVHVPRPARRYQALFAEHGLAFDLATVEEALAEARRRQDERFPSWVTNELVLDRSATAGRRAIHVDTMVELAEGREPLRQAFYDLFVGTTLFTLHTDVLRTLTDLRDHGYQLGIVSNWEPRLPDLCAAHGIAEFFTFMVVSETEGYSKPHRSLYERALELAGASPEETVHVGDKLREDVEGAQSVGIHAILLDRKQSQSAVYQPCISTLTQLPDLIAQFF